MIFTLMVVVSYTLEVLSELPVVVIEGVKATKWVEAPALTVVWKRRIGRVRSRIRGYRRSTALCRDVLNNSRNCCGSLYC